uniref:Uncharacterized protein n=1 Tax=Wuchereria bancrofti TaxID=6293 RepID=A0A1I8E9B6_WUCBA
EILWELKISDIALKLLYKDELLYAAITSGILTIFERQNEIRNENLWLATACKVTVICMKSLTTLRKIYVTSSLSVHDSPMFEKIRCGVSITVRSLDYNSSFANVTTPEG